MDALRGVFFDVGNTLTQLDYGFVQHAIALHDRSLPLRHLIRIDAEVRFGIDRAVARQMSERPAPADGTVPLAPPGLSPLWGRYFPALLERLDVPTDRWEAIVARLRERERADGAGLWSSVEPDVRETLRRLRQAGYWLGVISNSDGRIGQRLDSLGLRDYFHVVVDSGVVGIEKPDRRLFDLTLRRSHLEASAAVYVGDLYSLDILGARRAGLHAVLYDRADLYGAVEPIRLTALSQLPRLIGVLCDGQHACV